MLLEAFSLYTQSLTAFWTALAGGGFLKLLMLWGFIYWVFCRPRWRRRRWRRRMRYAMGFGPWGWGCHGGCGCGCSCGGGHDDHHADDHACPECGRSHDSADAPHEGTADEAPKSEANDASEAPAE